jgi:hypothetical protein
MNDKLSAAGGALDKITLVIEDPALLTNKYLRFKSNSEPVGATSDGLNPPDVPDPTVVPPSPAAAWYASDPYNNPNNPNPEHVYHAPHVNPNNPDAAAESINLLTHITQPADLPWIITYFIEVLWNPFLPDGISSNPYYMPDIEIGFIMDIGVKDRQWAYYGWQGTKQMSGNSKMGQQYSFPGSKTPYAKGFDPRLADSYYFRGPHGIKLVASAYTNSNEQQDPPAVDSNNNNILFEKVSLGAVDQQGSPIPGYDNSVNPLSVNGTFPVPAPTQSRNREVNPCPNLYQALHYISDLNLCLTNSTLCPWNIDKRIITIASFDSEGGADGYEGELPLGGNANATPSGKNPTTQWSPVAPSFNRTIRGTYVGSGNLTNASETDQNTPNRSGITITYPAEGGLTRQIQRGFGANCSNQDYVNNLWHAFTSGGVFAGGLPSIKQGIPLTSAPSLSVRNKQSTARGKWGITSSSLSTPYQLNTALVPGTDPTTNHAFTPYGYWFWGDNVGPSIAAGENYNIGNGTDVAGVTTNCAPVGGEGTLSDVPVGGGGGASTAYTASHTCGSTYSPSSSEQISNAKAQYWLWNYCFSKSAKLKNNSNPFFVPYNQCAMYSIENAGTQCLKGYFDNTGSTSGTCGTGDFFGSFGSTQDFIKWLDVVQEKTKNLTLFPDGMNNILMYDGAFLPIKWINESVEGNPAAAQSTYIATTGKLPGNLACVNCNYDLY